uniref:Uncharacterized protein n=1 Tax=Anguilla anguilla TaxID=7936 RepID=A0A0E9PBE3_ANGAN
MAHAEADTAVFYIVTRTTNTFPHSRKKWVSRGFTGEGRE